MRNLLDTRYGKQYTSLDGGRLHPDHEADRGAAIEKQAMQQSIETIGTRINSLGVSEPTIQEYNLGTNQILVELPGVDDPAACATLSSPPPGWRSMR